MGGALVALLMVSACDKDQNKPNQGKPEEKKTAEISNVKAEITTAEIKLATKGLTEYAYLVYGAEEETEEDPTLIFVSGTKGELKDGDNSVIISGLEANSSYKAVFALKDAEEYYEDLLLAEINTTDYVETFTLIETYSDGVKFNLKVPQSVREAGNVLRWGIATLPMYKNWKSEWQYFTDAEMLLHNGNVFGNYIKNDSTFVFNGNNIYETDENGEPIMDPMTGDFNLIHFPFTPGEPVIFMAGEFSWYEYPENPDDDIYGFGQGGYFDALFDSNGFYGYGDGGDDWEIDPWSVDVQDDMTAAEDEYWKGFYIRRKMICNPPTKLDANIDIDINAKAIDGTITITPDDKVLKYGVWLTDEMTYQQALQEFLGGDESLIQWFVTSYFAATQIGVPVFEGTTEIGLKEFFWEVAPESEYRVVVVGIGDEDLMTQCYYNIPFSTTAKTLPAPEVEVKALPSDDPYHVSFNVKCTTKDAASAKYAMNYTREWEMEFNAGNTVADLVSQGYSLSAADVAQMNTEEGLNLTFSCMPNSSNSLGILAYNEEDTCNEREAYATVASPKEKALDPVDSKLLDRLTGEWTMTSEGCEGKTKVTVSNGFTYPETLDQSVYDTYASMSKPLNKEEVDALFAEFKQEIDEYNAWLKGQNRVVCLGFGFEDPNGYIKYYTVNTPFDLFCSKTYTGYDNESMIWDCGPKWYLDVNADGSVVAPINMERFYPSNLAGYYTTYFVGYDSAKFSYLPSLSDGSNATFPVEVAADNSTITVNALAAGDYVFYPNMLRFFYGSAQTCGQVIKAPVVLAKGWTEETETTSVSRKSVNSQNVNASAAFGYAPKSANAVMRKTPLHSTKKVNKVVYKPVSFEEAQQRLNAAYGRK